MDQVSYTSLRNNLASVIEQVNEDHKPILITRQNGKAGVLMSLEDFQSYEETAYLIASPKNAGRLHNALQEVRAGAASDYSLVEDDS